MRLVLRPGHIYLHQKLIVNKHMRRRGTVPARVSLESKSSSSGPNVLATCRQLYGEWHEFYYSSNVFYIPTSSIMNMQPNHRAFVQHVGFRLSLLDVIPSKTEEVETLAGALARGVEDIATPAFKEHIIYPLCCAAVLLEVWLSNISSIQESFSGLKTLSIEMRTQVEPQRLLRLVTAAENINSSGIGYRFESFDNCRADQFIAFKRKWREQDRLDGNLGMFLDFAAKQVHDKLYRDIPLRTGTWENFKDSVDADFMKEYDDAILGGDRWSYDAWDKWKKQINRVTECVEVV